jgi:hypothetical protein
MLSFILKLDPETREELYSDVAVEFLDLIMLEAIFVIFQMANPYDYPLVDDIEYLADDPDSQFEASVEYLLGVLAETNPMDGVLTPNVEDLVEYDPGYRDAIMIKLGAAVDAINAMNDPSEMAAIKNILSQPGFQKRFKFNSLHLNDRVVYSISPDALDSLGLPTIPRIGSLIGGVTADGLPVLPLC